MSIPSVDFVLPTYKKSATLSALIRRLQELFDEHDEIRFRAIFVLDGPDSEAQAIFKLIEDRRICVVSLEQNSGKGAATRAAIPSIEGQVVVTIDADLDIDPRSAITGIRLILNDAESSIGCVYGSKFHRDSKVTYPPTRKFMSNCFRMVTRVLFDLDISDSQTGLKVYPVQTFRQMAVQCGENRFLFDLELMVLIAKQKKKLLPIPVDLSFQYDSTIKLREVSRFLFDVVQLSRRLKRSHQIGVL